MSHLSERLSEAETEQIMREVVVECTAVFERVDQFIATDNSSKRLNVVTLRFVRRFLLPIALTDDSTIILACKLFRNSGFLVLNRIATDNSSKRLNVVTLRFVRRFLLPIALTDDSTIILACKLFRNSGFLVLNRGVDGVSIPPANFGVPVSLGWVAEGYVSGSWGKAATAVGVFTGALNDWKMDFQAPLAHLLTPGKAEPCW
ncbi:hypothetical protein M514_26516 [Trichuris suis]|uniref:Uncharacterized protein n=1 Tax=Trichuris suis TaxID=68888 RepID=A0A085MVS7_9BILA|nr:hypothetical protein M514_26516 [Trichuris suis]